MTWASELAQTLQEPTEMTRKLKAILSFFYILICQFLEGPRNQDKRQEEARSVSSFNGSVSNTAVSARGLLYVLEGSVSARSHADSKACCYFCSQGCLLLRPWVPYCGQWKHARAWFTPQGWSWSLWILCPYQAFFTWHFARYTMVTLFPLLVKSAVFSFTVLSSLCQMQPLLGDLGVYGKVQKSYMSLTKN